MYSVEPFELDGETVFSVPSPPPFELPTTQGVGGDEPTVGGGNDGDGVSFDGASAGASCGGTIIGTTAATTSTTWPLILPLIPIFIARKRK